MQQQPQWQIRPRDEDEQLMNQQTPNWMAARQQMQPPDWASKEDANRNNNSGGSSSTGPREHIIPIMLEQTPTKTPSTPGFGPQPFYNAQQQYQSVQSPTGGYGSPTAGMYIGKCRIFRNKM